MSYELDVFNEMITRSKQWTANLVADISHVKIVRPFSGWDMKDKLNQWVTYCGINEDGSVVIRKNSPAGGIYSAPFYCLEKCESAVSKSPSVTTIGDVFPKPPKSSRIGYGMYFVDPVVEDIYVLANVNPGTVCLVNMITGNSHSEYKCDTACNLSKHECELVFGGRWRDWVILDREEAIKTIKSIKARLNMCVEL
jgi:hypothetical protein